MKKLFVFLLLLLPFIGNAQNPIPIYTGLNYHTPFISENGDEVFRLPKGHRPIMKFPVGLWFNQVNKVYAMDPFKEGLCPVLTQDGNAYFVTPQGKKVINLLNRYDKISPFYEGKCVAFQRVGRTYDYWHFYIDKTGEIAFGGRKFWKAGPFSEGLAGVQLTKEGQWGYIDEKGEMVISLDFGPEKEVFSLHAFSDGRAKVVVENKKAIRSADKYLYYFINTKGEVVIDLQRQFPKRTFNTVWNFEDGFAAITFNRSNDSYQDVAYINPKGESEYTFKKLKKVTPFQHGWSFLVEVKQDGAREKPVESPFLVDVKGRIKRPEPYKKQVVNDIFQLFPEGYYAVPVGMEGETQFALYSLKKHEAVYATSKVIKGIKNELVLEFDLFESTQKIKTLDGELVWKTPDENRIFTDLQMAMKVKRDVRHFRSKHSKDFPGVYQLPNLQILELEQIKNFQSFPPGIKNLKDLEKLQLTLLPLLKELPMELAEMENLHTVNVFDCRSLKGFEPVIRAMPQLRELVLQNVEIEKGFIQEMKRLNPQLKISWYQTAEAPLDIQKADEY